jgi:hypothetical protein
VHCVGGKHEWAERGIEMGASMKSKRTGQILDFVLTFPKFFGGIQHCGFQVNRIVEQIQAANFDIDFSPIQVQFSGLCQIFRYVGIALNCLFEAPLVDGEVRAFRHGE